MARPTSFFLNRESQVLQLRLVSLKISKIVDVGLKIFGFGSHWLAGRRADGPMGRWADGPIGRLADKSIDSSLDNEMKIKDCCQFKMFN